MEKYDAEIVCFQENSVWQPSAGTVPLTAYTTADLCGVPVLVAEPFLLPLRDYECVSAFRVRRGVSEVLKFSHSTCCFFV